MVGHVGITTAPNLYQDAYQVIEVIGFEGQPVIRTSTIADFKTKSSYWGSRYGISDGGVNALRILKEANFQKDLGIPSLRAIDLPSKYRTPTLCG